MICIWFVIVLYGKHHRTTPTAVHLKKTKKHSNDESCIALLFAPPFSVSVTRCLSLFSLCRFSFCFFFSFCFVLQFFFLCSLAHCVTSKKIALYIWFLMLMDKPNKRMHSVWCCWCCCSMLSWAASLKKNDRFARCFAPCCEWRCKLREARFINDTNIVYVCEQFCSFLHFSKDSLYGTSRLIVIVVGIFIFIHS